MWTVPKDAVYTAIAAVQVGLEYAQMCLMEHDSNLGRAALKNRSWALTMENDIRQMQGALTVLKSLPSGSAPDRVQEC